MVFQVEPKGSGIVDRIVACKGVEAVRGLVRMYMDRPRVLEDAMVWGLDCHCCACVERWWRSVIPLLGLSAFTGLHRIVVWIVVCALVCIILSCVTC